MAKKPRNKKYNPKPEGLIYLEKTIEYSPEDSFNFTVEMYYRLLRFKKNVAQYADRTTVMVRLYAGQSVLDRFNHNGADGVFERAIDILKGCRDHVTKKLRQLTTDELNELSQAVCLTDEMFSQLSLWAEVEASKKGEDRMIVGATNYEYRFKQVSPEPISE